MATVWSTPWPLHSLNSVGCVCTHASTHAHTRMHRHICAHTHTRSYFFLQLMTVDETASATRLFWVTLLQMHVCDVFYLFTCSKSPPSQWIGNQCCHHHHHDHSPNGLYLNLVTMSQHSIANQHSSALTVGLSLLTYCLSSTAKSSPCLLHQYAHPVQPTYIWSAHLCSCVCHNVMAQVCNNGPIISQSTPFEDLHTNITYSALCHLLRTVKKALHPTPTRQPPLPLLFLPPLTTHTHPV